MSTSSEDDGGDVTMRSASGDGEDNTSYRPFTKAERIQQLNDIDKVRFWNPVSYMS
jgi:hypothetical protein